MVTGSSAGESVVGPAPEAVRAVGARPWSGLATRLLPVAGKSSLAILDQAAISGARFLTTVLIGRLCGASALGIYTLGFALVIIGACVQEALLSTPYAIHSPRLQGDAGRAYAGSLLIQHWMLAGLLVAALAVTGALITVGAGPMILAEIIWVLVAIIPFTLLQDCARRYLFAHLRMRTALWLDAGVAIIQIGGLLLLAASSALTIRSACLVLGAGCAIPTVGWLWHSRADFAVRLGQVGGDIRRNLAFGKWVLASQMTGVLRGYAALWILALMHDTTATGAFAAASSIVLVSNPITMGITNLLTPQAARARQRGGVPAVGRVVTRTTLLLAAVIALFCLALTLVGDQVLQLLYGAEFAGHRQLLVVLGLGLLVRTLGLGLDCGLRAIDLPDMNLRAGGANLVVTCILALLLVGNWGSCGVAYSLLIGNTVGFLLRLRVFARMVK